MYKSILTAAVLSAALCVGCGGKGKVEQSASAAPDTASAVAPNVEPVTRPPITTFVDSRDGKTYKKVTIGTQTWMAENLNYAAEGSKCYGEGAPVEITDPHDFHDSPGGYKPVTKTLSDKEVKANCVKYGRLYDWPAAQEACPAGWHLPSNDEWNAMEEYVESRENSSLRAASGWKIHRNGTDDYGFAALPGGFRSLDDGNYEGVGGYAGWWSSTENDPDSVRGRFMYHYGYRNALGWIRGSKSGLNSVRCVRDEGKEQ